MLAAVHTAPEEMILRAILQKVPETKEWLPIIKFIYIGEQMEIILNDLPEDIARKIMAAFSKG